MLLKSKSDELELMICFHAQVIYQVFYQSFSAFFLSFWMSCSVCPVIFSLCFSLLWSEVVFLIFFLYYYFPCCCFCPLEFQGLLLTAVLKRKHHVAFMYFSLTFSNRFTLTCFPSFYWMKTSSCKKKKKWIATYFDAPAHNWEINSVSMEKRKRRKEDERDAGLPRLLSVSCSLGCC